MEFGIRVFLIAIINTLLCVSFTVLFNLLEEHDTVRAGQSAMFTTILAALLFQLLEF